MSNTSTEKTEISKISVIEGVLNKLEIENEISKQDILKYIIDNKEKTISVSASLFRQGLSPLQAVVKYLVENRAYNYSEISKILNRDPRTIWNTYHEANKIIKSKIDILDKKYPIQLSIFSDRNYSFLEHVCVYMKENFGLNYHEIAIAIGKNDRTVWTVCRRYEQKKRNKENAVKNK